MLQHYEFETVKPFVEEDFYLVRGVCTTGSRHCSQLKTFDEVLKTIPSYVSLIQYFGGGTVTVFDKTGDIIHSILVDE